VGINLIDAGNSRIKWISWHSATQQWGEAHAMPLDLWIETPLEKLP
jgi:pantothenate kinase type III